MFYNIADGTVERIDRSIDRSIHSFIYPIFSPINSMHVFLITEICPTETISRDALSCVFSPNNRDDVGQTDNIEEKKTRNIERYIKREKKKLHRNNIILC
jgi:hypothetical protein